MEEKYKKFIEKFKETKLNEPMAKYTNFKVGGPADLLFEAKSSDELAEVVKTAIDLGIPYLILGHGTNILVSDKGIRGLVIKNSTSEIKFSDNFVEADSGVKLVQLIDECKGRNLQGVEVAYGVPGTVGGAIIMNAGTKNEWIGQYVAVVKVIDEEGSLKEIKGEEAGFGYRTSIFQKGGYLILSAKFKLNKLDSPESIEAKIAQIDKLRSKQPAGPSVGSTFRNPPGNSAGKLIEECGLKGKRIGGAKISEKHANFIINEGNATAADIKSLIDLVKKIVKEKFGVDLIEEVRYVGEW